MPDGPSILVMTIPRCRWYLRHRCLPLAGSRRRHYLRYYYEKMAGQEVRQGKGGGVVERWRSDHPRDRKCRCRPQTASDRLPHSRQTACIVALDYVLGAANIFFFVVIVETKREKD